MAVFEPRIPVARLDLRAYRLYEGQSIGDKGVQTTGFNPEIRLTLSSGHGGVGGTPRRR